MYLELVVLRQVTGDVSSAEERRQLPLIGSVHTTTALILLRVCVYVWYNISVSEDAHNIDSSLVPRPSLDLPAFIVSCKKQERDIFVCV